MIPAFLRNHPLPDFTTVEEADPIVMLFVVNDDKNTSLASSSVLEAAAQACMDTLTAPANEAAVEAWLGGRIRKIVKRGRNKAWDTALESLPNALGTVNEASVAAFAPEPSSSVPEALRKLQVNGLIYTDDLRDVSELAPDPHTLVVVLRKDLGMSLGKQVAQACHIVQLFAMNSDASQVEEWDAAGRHVKVAYVNGKEDIEALDTVVEVRDAGFTEVAPNTLTAAGIYL